MRSREPSSQGNTWFQGVQGGHPSRSSLSGWSGVHLSLQWTSITGAVPSESDPGADANLRDERAHCKLQMWGLAAQVTVQTASPRTSQASWSVPLTGSRPQKCSCLSFSDASQFTLLLFRNILEHRGLIIHRGETSACDDWGLKPRTSQHHPGGGHTVTLRLFMIVALSLVHKSREENALLSLAVTTNPKR